MPRYPERVREDVPEKTIGNVPDEVLKSAMSEISYIRCKECGAEQWAHIIPGHNSRKECEECGETIRLVG